MISGVTANAQLLCGYVSGLLARDSADAGAGFLAYLPKTVSADRGAVEVEEIESGNRFRISIEQIGGEE